MGFIICEGTGTTHLSGASFTIAPGSASLVNEPCSHWNGLIPERVGMCFARQCLNAA